ncbi:MAG: SIMPL domain-containing protein [Patescibacteria group bacterium]|nr:SIMPL domain-containing protein [Patescibacteria group bacterium]MDE1966011.1 SIMPL domain-containing protein [Patescibacteria group bacterium]
MHDEPIRLRELASSATVRIALTGTLAMLSLFLLAETFSLVSGMLEPTAPPADTITVSGDGKATAVPDVAKISFSVMETAKQVADAQAAATKRADAALAAVKAAGVSDKDVRTTSYDVSPQYAYPHPCLPGEACPNYGSPTITGYQVSESIEVTVHDLAKTGDILQSLGTLGVQNVSGPQFTVNDTSAVMAAARADAIAKAQADASRLSAALGVSLGRVVSFSENANAPYPIFAMGAAAMSAKDAASAPTLPTGQNEYDAHVSITYAIR